MASFVFYNCILSVCSGTWRDNKTEYLTYFDTKNHSGNPFKDTMLHFKENI
ncbi:hypothetical protein CLOHYLEM_05668 [[Clostridium] hylemonae DSM 15053]|uniref:Uncharacterized protein n=1 Tax=[Clostridium] hylemonae DSM 15053 TaxID=553973 RepID=C0C0R5_9FIRM|nr:hypothetical protein CLOHYLEM_05668 [[Clostridium] hylemonae DSM 15053]